MGTCKEVYRFTLLAMRSAVFMFTFLLVWANACLLGKYLTGEVRSDMNNQIQGQSGQSNSIHWIKYLAIRILHLRFGPRYLICRIRVCSSSSSQTKSLLAGKDLLEQICIARTKILWLDCSGKSLIKQVCDLCHLITRQFFVIYLFKSYANRDLSKFYKSCFAEL